MIINQQGAKIFKQTCSFEVSIGLLSPILIVSSKESSEIIRRAERQLLNECIRSINNMIKISMFRRDTYFHQLEGVIDRETLQECKNFINKVRECRHNKVLDGQKRKFEALLQKTNGHSKQDVWKIRNKNGTNEGQDLDRENREKKRWMINLSSTPLTEEQERLLDHRQKFVITPRETPVKEYIVATEQACTKIEQGKQEEFRVEVKSLLKQDQNNKRQANISKEELKALKELKLDNNRLILTAEKGVALVVIDKDDYIKKVEDLLKENTYKKIAEDPTPKQKNKLISILRNIKAEGGLKEEVYRRLYPTGPGSPKFYGLPKIHKSGISLRPIISSIGTVTYNTAKELARILKPLGGCPIIIYKIPWIL